MALQKLAHKQEGSGEGTIRPQLRYIVRSQSEGCLRELKNTSASSLHHGAIPPNTTVVSLPNRIASSGKSIGGCYEGTAPIRRLTL